MKRTPLKRTAAFVKKVPLPRGETVLKRMTRIKPRSDKTARVYRDHRTPLVRRLLAERPQCQAKIDGLCTTWAVDVHEVKSRGRGGSITDEANCLTVCRACHDFITTHPERAHELGLLKHSWEAA